MGFGHLRRECESILTKNPMKWRIGFCKRVKLGPRDRAWTPAPRSAQTGHPTHQRAPPVAASVFGPHALTTIEPRRVTLVDQESTLSALCEAVWG
jgi:hypothetical protein